MNKQLNYDENKWLSHDRKAKLKRDYYGFIKKQAFSWHLTGNFNRETSKTQGQLILKNWAARVDSELHGKKWHLKTKEGRVFFIAFPEIGCKSGYLHYHILAKVPIYSENKFEKIAHPIWRNLVPPGDLLVQKIGSSDNDNCKVVSYDLKEIWRYDNHEDIVISTQFSSVH